MDILSYILGKKAGGGGGEAVLVNKDISANGTYNASSDNADGYKKVVVDVPNSYGAGDEGKVVSNGALVAQGSDTVTANDTYDTTLINSMTVSVPMPLEPAEEQDVNFFDYTGECVYSHTKDEFLALSAYPAYPSHSGLVGYEWNWSLTDAKAYVTKYGCLNIGAIYKTADGATHIFFEIYDIAVASIGVRCKPSVSGGVTIDWGDGSTDTVSGTSYVNTSHTYAAVGKYEAKVLCESGTVEFGGGSGMNILGSYGGHSMGKNNTVTEIWFGNNVTFGTHVLAELNRLRRVVFPYNMTAVGNYWYRENQLFDILIYPSTFTTFSGTGNWVSVKTTIIFPKSATGIVKIETQQYNSKVMSPPEGMYYMQMSNFPMLLPEKIIVPDGVTEIDNNAYRTAKTAHYLYIGKDVASIGQTICMNTVLNEIHLAPTTPPALANTNAFANWLQYDTGVKFYVPYSADHSVLNAYKTASNWSTFADYMQEEAQ